MIIQADFSYDGGSTRRLFDNVTNLTIYGAKLTDKVEKTNVGSKARSVFQFCQEFNGDFLSLLAENGSPPVYDTDCPHEYPATVIDFISQGKYQRILTDHGEGQHVYVMNDAGKTIQTI